MSVYERLRELAAEASRTCDRCDELLQLGATSCECGAHLQVQAPTSAQPTAERSVPERLVCPNCLRACSEQHCDLCGKDLKPVTSVPLVRSGGEV